MDEPAPPDPLWPAVLDHSPRDRELVTSETFGPIAPVLREVPGFRTELTPFAGVGDSGIGVKEVGAARATPIARRSL